MSRRKRPTQSAEAHVDVASELRIIGGKFRGSRLEYHGERTTRPMKHRLREAIFNLLGTDIAGKHAIDVFAGTGAIGLEAISRGAASATFIERHVPTARLVQENIRRLDVSGQCELLCMSAFMWARMLRGSQATDELNDFRFQISDFRFQEEAARVAWAVFCSPPYDFYVDRQTEMVELVGLILANAPPESILVVEADQRLDFDLLPVPMPGEGADVPTGIGPLSPYPVVDGTDESAGFRPSSRRAPPGERRLRPYPPAQIGILRVPPDKERLSG